MDTTGFTKLNIKLPTGATLEVEASDRFLDVVKSHFELPSKSEVQEDHIRMYVWGAFKNALDKAEKESTT